MKEIIDVQTGEALASSGSVLLQSNGIGSCVVVVMLDPKSSVAGLAHVMLPGQAPEGEAEKNKYANDAINHLLESVVNLGGVRNQLLSCLLGAANVLKRKDDTICEANIVSARKELNDLGIPVLYEDLGGDLRRRVTLDVCELVLHGSVGDNDEKIIFQFPSS